MNTKMDDLQRAEKKALVAAELERLLPQAVAGKVQHSVFVSSSGLTTIRTHVILNPTASGGEGVALVAP